MVTAVGRDIGDELTVIGPDEYGNIRVYDASFDDYIGLDGTWSDAQVRRVSAERRRAYVAGKDAGRAIAFHELRQFIGAADRDLGLR